MAHLQLQKEELCAQIRDLSVPLNLSFDSVPELKKQLREIESREKERTEEIAKMTSKIQQQEQVLLLNFKHH